MFPRAVWAILLLALAVRAQLALGTFLIHQDSTIYLAAAKGIAARPTCVPPDYYEHPLPAYVLAVAAGNEQLSYAICILVGSLGIFGAFGAGRVLGGGAVGLLAAFFYALHPLLVGTQSEILADSFAQPLTALAFWAALEFAETGGRRRGAWAGALLGLVVLTRLDGYVLAGAVGIPLLLRAMKTPERFAAGLAVGLAFLLLSMGALSARASVLWGNWAPSPDPTFQCLIARGLRPEAPVQGSDVPEIYEAARKRGRWVGPLRDVLDRARRSLDEAMIVLAVLGLATARGLAGSTAARRVLWGATLLALGFAVFVMVWRLQRTDLRYFSVASVGLIPLAALGAEGLARRLGVRRPRAAWAVPVLVLLVAGWWMYPAAAWRRVASAPVAEAGRWARERAPRLRVPWSTDVRFAYYAGAKRVLTGSTPEEAVAAFREGRVNCVVVREGDAAWFPERFEELRAVSGAPVEEFPRRRPPWSVRSVYVVLQGVRR